MPFAFRRCSVVTLQRYSVAALQRCSPLHNSFLRTSRAKSFRYSDRASFAFTKREQGGTPSYSTGPSAGVGGSGPYVYAETSSPRVQGDLFTLACDGSACCNMGLRVSTVTFHYHMYGATMGTLAVTNAAGEVVWSLSGNQGNAWQAAAVDMYSRRAAVALPTVLPPPVPPRACTTPWRARPALHLHANVWVVAQPVLLVSVLTA